MRKGFTLIELLAVIVILAIIALIATPIVLNIIEESKNNSNLRSAEMYLAAVDYAIANRMMNNGKLDNKVYPIMSDGNICLEDYVDNECIGIEGRKNHKDDILVVEVKGKKPDSGTIIIENGQIVSEKNTKLYLEAVKIKMESENLSNGSYSIMSDGNICLGQLTNNTCTGFILKIEVDIAKPDSGTINKTESNITLNDDNEEKTEIIMGGQTIIKNKNGKLEKAEAAKLKKFSDICTSAKEQLYNQDPLGEGHKYNCKVDPNKETYVFFVLNSTEEKVNLIMEQNINSDGTLATKAITKANAENGVYNLVPWLSVDDFNDNGGVVTDEMKNDGASCQYAGNCVSNVLGPITAMDFLEQATKNWTNLSKDHKINTSKKEYKLYSRLPHSDELRSPDFITSSRPKPEHLYQYGYIEDSEINQIDGIHGYWSQTPFVSTGGSSRVNIAWGLEDYNGVQGFAVNANNMGIRPVISLKL